MMRHALWFTVFTIRVVLCSTRTLTAPDVSGTWDLEMRFAPKITSAGTCAFRQDHEMLTGTCGGNADRFQVTHGEVIGNQVSWQLEVTQDGSAGLMRFAGELDRDGTTISGSLAIDGGADGTFTMKKKP